jgi:hypothetical protein
MGFPVGSRTTVQGPTQGCLTSVFGMGTGDPARYGRPTTNVKIQRSYPDSADFESADPGQDRMNHVHTQPFGSRKSKPNSLT